MSIVIACDSFLSLRNVRNADLGRRLSGERVLVLVDPNQYAGCASAAPDKIEVGRLLDFNAEDDPQLRRLLHRCYYTRKCYYDPTTFWSKLEASSYRNNPKPGLRRLASLTKARFELARNWSAGLFGLAIDRRWEFALALRRHPIVAEYKRLLRRWGASVVVGFSPEGFRESPLIEAANDLSIPTAVMIRSRDNLAAKIQYLPFADKYLVWSQVIRRYFLRVYPETSPLSVVVTGSPQFDRHLDPAFRLAREAFFDIIRLDPAKPLIVYTMLTPGLSPMEVNIAQHLADAAHAGRFLRDGQLLVRGHPRMFGSNVRVLHQEYAEARCYPKTTDYPYNSAEHEAQVVQLILEDEPVHLATLAYQDVQVNVNGTMTIDSAVLDKPTVNVCYDMPPDVNPGYSVKRLYLRTDSKWMQAYGGSRLARGPEECLTLINEYLAHPELDAEGRRRAGEGDCGPLDGASGKRIAAQISSLAAGGKLVETVAV